MPKSSMGVIKPLDAKKATWNDGPLLINHSQSCQDASKIRSQDQKLRKLYYKRCTLAKTKQKRRSIRAMKVIKRGLFLLAILVFGVGQVRSALADGGGNSAFPADGTYSFAMVGANTNATTDVPTTAISGVFTVKGGSSTFAVSNGEFMLNDDRNICTAQFGGTGTPIAAGITS